MKKLIFLIFLQFPVASPLNQDQWVIGIGDLEALASGNVRNAVYQQTSGTTGTDSIISLQKATVQVRADIDHRLSLFTEDLCISNADLCKYLLSKYNLRWSATSPLAIFGMNPTTGVNPFSPNTPLITPIPIPTAPPNPFGR